MKSDKQLQKDVLAELNWEPAVNAAHIGVEVREGIVTLAGEVDTYGEKWDAERAAQRVNGVMGLTVEMHVKPSGPHPRSDVDIARSAENVLQWTNNVPADQIKVMVENGWLTLSGDVDWDYQRRLATRAVRHLMGVQGVSDNIAIKPRISLSAVKTDIEAALKRRAASKAEKISVEVHGADVTLSGTVGSWAERNLATHSAWSTPGVRQVIDNIRVAH